MLPLKTSDRGMGRMSSRYQGLFGCIGLILTFHATRVLHVIDSSNNIHCEVGRVLGGGKQFEMNVVKVVELSD